MKTIQQIEQLLRKGKKPKELLELGFSKRAITSARRQLKKEKSEVKPVISKKPELEKYGQLRVVPVEDMEPAQQRLAAVESYLGELNARVELLEAVKVQLKDIEAKLNGTPAINLNRFKCQCGVSGHIALYVHCTECNSTTLWGWFPE